MTSTATPNYTVSQKSVKYFPIAGSLYATGTEFSSYYIANLNTGTKRTFTSPSAFEWSLRVLESAAKPIVARWRVASLILYIAANRKPAPMPTPPAAAALRIVPQASVYAVSNSRKENKVNIPTRTQGTIVNCHNSADEMIYWLNHHAAKYGAVTRISVNPYSFIGMGTVGDVEIYRTESVLPGYVWMGTDSAKASAACVTHEKDKRMERAHTIHLKAIIDPKNPGAQYRSSDGKYMTQAFWGKDCFKQAEEARCNNALMWVYTGGRGFKDVSEPPSEYQFAA